MNKIIFIALWGFSALGENATQGVIYSPYGKRDPFKVPILRSTSKEDNDISPLEKYNLAQFQLRAILKGIGKSRALFEDPEGKTHILTEGDVLGREKARISRIVNQEVIVTEKTFDYLGRQSLLEKVLSLPKDSLEAEDAVPVRSNASEAPVKASSGEPKK